MAEYQAQKSKGVGVLFPRDFERYYVFCEECNIWTPRNEPVNQSDPNSDDYDFSTDKLECYTCRHCNYLNYSSYEFDGEHINCWGCYRKYNKKCEHDFCNECNNNCSIFNCNSSCTDCWKCFICKQNYENSGTKVEDFKLLASMCIRCIDTDVIKNTAYTGRMLEYEPEIILEEEILLSLSDNLKDLSKRKKSKKPIIVKNVDRFENKRNKKFPHYQ
jgi:hypothetical protein